MTSTETAQWLVRSERTSRVVAGPFDSSAEARDYCGGSDDVYAARVDFDADVARYDLIRDSADAIDEDHDGDVASNALDAVEADHPGADEDHPVAFARLVDAMDKALDEARETYRDAEPPRHWGASGWESEAFPKAVLGLYP